MALNVLMLAPLGGRTTTVNGRVYSATDGTTITAPDFDAEVLESNGWLRIGNGGSGTTAQRPVLTKANRGQHYHDNTLGKLIFWEGANWRDASTGGVV
ncbi:MAG: hypothetical protein JO253_03570 [Alphaproteobacteria bacterium]|nr:hypothetical protein [Alphaproteobacteria bacterium]